MYPKYFGLKEPSFSIAPDPEYLFLSEQHKEALAHLLYGAGESGGFVLLSGEVGTGKTTVCRAFLEQIPEGVDVALILNPAMTANELMLAICDEFQILVPERERSVKALVDRLNAYLLDAHARGRRPVLMIDEAQNLRPKVLEQIRLLTNLETTKHKLLQIFLIGQPELRTLLARPGLRQLNQRITARFHLMPLSIGETGAYIRHRLMIAGVDRPLFTRSAIKRIHKASGGVPRLINVLCDRALLGACVRRAALVSPAIVDQAVNEVSGDGEPVVKPPPRPMFVWSLFASLLVLALFAGWHARDRVGEDPGVSLSDQIASLILAPDGQAGSDTIGETEANDAATEQVQPAAPEVDAAAAAEEDIKVQPTVQAEPIEIAQGVGALARQDVDVAEAAEPRLPEGLTDTAEPPEVGAAIGVVAGVADKPKPAQRIPSAEAGVDKQVRLQLTDEDLDHLTTDRTTALRILLRRWGVELGEVRGGDPCTKIATFGLLCEPERGTWANLRYFDRPAVIRVAGGNGYLVVGALDADSATLDLDSGSEQVATRALDDYWTGDYVLIWQPPPVAGVSMIGPRSFGAPVTWLRKLISRVPGLELADVESNSYTSELGQAITRFQTDRGLDADGVAGPRTLVQLHNAVAMPGIPKLSN